MSLNKLLIILSVFSFSPAEGAIYFLQKPVLLSNADQVDYETNRPEGYLKFVKAEHGDYTMIIKGGNPASQRSIERKLKRMKGDLTSLQSRPVGSGQTIFGFKNREGQLHFFSTHGGYLQITPKTGDATQTVTAWMERFQK